MNKVMKESLEKAGIDVLSAIDRFMGNEALFTKFLIKFLDDPSYKELKNAIAAGDKEAALIASHMLKGVSGNMSMNELYELCSKQVVAFRADEWDKGIDMMPEIAQKYKTLVEVIRIHVS